MPRLSSYTLKKDMQSMLCLVARFMPCQMLLTCKRVQQARSLLSTAHILLHDETCVEIKAMSSSLPGVASCCAMLNRSLFPIHIYPSQHTASSTPGTMSATHPKHKQRHTPVTPSSKSDQPTIACSPNRPSPHPTADSAARSSAASNAASRLPHTPENPAKVHSTSTSTFQLPETDSALKHEVMQLEHPNTGPQPY
jgi:hypothetical protein